MDPKSSIEARTYIVMTLLALLPIAITIKMLSIAIVDGPELRASYQAQPLVNETISSYRGDLLDRNGNRFRVNTIEYIVAADPTIKGFSEKAELLYKELGKATGRSANSYRRMVKNRTSREYIKMTSTWSESTIDHLDSLEIPGLIIKEKLDRVNIQEGIGRRVLGGTDPERNGISGLELLYDEFLKGENGKRVLFRDSRGQVSPVPGSPFIEPIHGEHLKLTLDIPRQAVMEDLLKNAVMKSNSRWGTSIAMNVHSGEILAIANYDNPKRRTGGSKSLERANRAISAVIEPGSTFKLVVYAAAIEHGLISFDDLMSFSSIRERVGDRYITDSHYYPELTMRDAIVKSSNIAAARVGLKVGEQKFYQMARDLGFGQPTLIDLPGESAGTLRPIEEWSKTSLETLSFGYEVGVTPIQMLVAYAALANGGRIVRPRLVSERLSPEGEVIWSAPPDSIRRAFSKETADLLTPAFEQVVESGTAQLAKVEGLKIAGKTGTSEKIINGKYADKHRASFVGFFPADNPQIAIYIAVDEPDGVGFGGLEAAPIFKNIAERWLSLSPELRQKEDMTSLDQQAINRNVIDKTATLPAIVANNIRQAHKVDSLLIEPADQQASRRMVNVRGLSTRQAVALLSSKGVKTKLLGSGIVTHQQPSPGEIIRGPAVLSGSD